MSTKVMQSSDKKKGRPTLFGEDDHKFEIIWVNVALYVYYHIAAFYGLLVPKTGGTHLVQLGMILLSAFGMTVGAHQLFAHRSFKANKKLKAMLIFMHTAFCLHSVHDYARYHRSHHKFIDTNADPHNSKRGFFFTHMGWLLAKKHEEFENFSKKIDIKDILTDKMVMFQHKYFLVLGFLIGFALPVSISWLFCGDSFITALNYNCFRHILIFHIALSTNSISHRYGYRPFDKDISATESYIMGTITFGGGWHNFHHTFPWDYKTSEMTAYWCNFSLAFVNFFAWLGWATDLKTVSQEVINMKAKRSGDGSRKIKDIDDNTNGKQEIDSGVWGWGDSSMTSEEKKCATILYQTVTPTK